MAWTDLLRPFRRETHGTRAPQIADTATNPVAARPRPPVALSRPRTRPTWALGGFDAFFGPFTRIPTAQNYNLYATLRETLPILDAAVHKTIQFVGVPSIDAEPDTKQAIEDWLGMVSVNRIQTGWTNWLATWLDNALTFGRAHTEIILTADRKDIYALLEVHPATIRLRPSTDRYSVEILQDQAITGMSVPLNPLLMLNAVHHIQGDDPNGTSLFWGLPFVAEIAAGMLKDLKSTWQRFGTPTYHVNWEPPEGFSDPDGAQSEIIMSAMNSRFNAAMESRLEGDVRDFFSSGVVKVEVIGAAGETLDFETPMRSLTEQIVAKTGIPPMAFGLQWSTTERMSAVQAGLLSSMIDHLRAEIESELTYLITLRQQLSGGDTQFKLCWPPANLLDDMDQARAHLFDEQARQTKISNVMNLWTDGFLTKYDAARELREDMAELDDRQIDQRLPDLPDQPPAPPAPAPLSGGGSAGPPPGNQPNAALVESMTNGNGRHN